MASQLSGTAGTLAANNQNYTTMLMHNFCFLFWKEIINKICFQNLTSWSTWIISMKLTFSNARTFVRNIYMICVFLRNKIWSILQSIYLTMNWKNYWIKGIFDTGLFLIYSCCKDYNTELVLTPITTSAHCKFNCIVE